MNTQVSRLKNTGFVLFTVLALAAGFSSKAQADIKILNFQAGAIGVFPSGGGSQFFGQVAWTPYFGLGTIGVRGDLGVTLLKNSVTGDRFMAINTEALLSLALVPGFSLEAGGGLHNWVSNGGTALALTGNAVFSALLGVDRVYLGFTRFFLGSGANEFRAGIGFDL